MIQKARVQGDSSGMFQRFFRSEVTGSAVLVACAALALGWANSPWASSYFELTRTYVGISWGDASFKLSLQHWINDGLMVLFFFVVGLEIKREIVVGQLSSFSRAVLPVTAAFGGMVVPAGLYLLLNAGGPGEPGWGVPMATDIAFALGILALLGSRVPIGLKVFLTALAIADDLGAVLVIAFFYTDTISLLALALAGVFLVLLFLANQLHLRFKVVYIVLGLGCWVAVLASGVHATVAGILVALVVPVRAGIDASDFLERTNAAIGSLQNLKGAGLTRDSMLEAADQYAALDNLHAAASAMRPSGLTLEYYLQPVQAYFILPLFALFNAGVTFDTTMLTARPDPITLGIVAGLFVGKQVGITLFGWLAVRSGRAVLPEGVSWRMIWGASCLAGVGFTMSLFIAELAFENPGLIGEAKIGILAGSLVAGVVGYVVLRWALRRQPAQSG